jgi:hypothetical protein
VADVDPKRGPKAGMDGANAVTRLHELVVLSPTPAVGSHGDRLAALMTVQVDLQSMSTCVLDDAGWRILGPLAAPLGQRQEHRPQFLTGGSEVIFETRWCSEYWRRSTTPVL